MADLPPVPEAVAEIARMSRDAFGPCVRIVRITHPVIRGNPAWDWYCREVDGEQDA